MGSNPTSGIFFFIHSSRFQTIKSMSWKGVKSDLVADLPARPSMDVVMDDIEKTSVNDVIYDFIQKNCGKFKLNSTTFHKKTTH